MTVEPGAGPGRKYLRFSVRGLIVIVLVVGGCLGWIVRSARIQHEAVAAIEVASHPKADSMKIMIEPHLGAGAE